MKFNKSGFSLKRDEFSDFLKGIAVILMIQVHVVELFAQPDVFESSIGKLSLFLGGVPVAPLFLAIMGYYAFQSSKQVTGLIYRGIKLILLGIALNIGLNLHLLIKIFSGAYLVDPLELVFGVDILICAGFSIIFTGLLKNYFKKAPWLIPVCIVLILGIAYLDNDLKIQHPFYKYFIAVFGGQYKWSYFPFFPWAAYVLAGGLFSIVGPKIKPSASILIPSIIAGLVFTVFTLRFATGITGNLPGYYHHDFDFFLWACAFLIFWSCLCFIMYQYVHLFYIMKPITLLGKNVTSAYIVQWLLIGNIATGIFRSFTLLQSLTAFILIVLITGIFVALSEKKFPVLFNRKK